MPSVRTLILRCALGALSAFLAPAVDAADAGQAQSSTQTPGGTTPDPAPAGASAVIAAPTLQDQAIRLYIQCDRAPCDQEFFRSELNWVNHVRDQRDADVHVLITGQPTGGGGSQYTFSFIGLRN